MSKEWSIWEGCKAGDPLSQRQLYEQYKSRLMGLCRRYAASREEAQDMLQDAFVKIFQRMNQVEAPDKLFAWMKSIAVRTAVDHYHRHKKHQHEDLEAAEEMSDDYEPLAMLVDDGVLVGLINQLPERSRLVFNLNVVEGYDHDEIASMLEITTATSRSQLHYAKALLKTKLKAIGILRYERIA